MNSDPAKNVVVFKLRRPGDDTAVAEGPTRADDGIRQAWAQASEKCHAAGWEVSALHCEWEPSDADKRFIQGTFSQVKDVTFTFSRPGPDGWDAAFAAARQTMTQTLEREQAAVSREQAPEDEQISRARQHASYADEHGELLPILWSHRSPEREMLDFLPHYVLVPGRLVVSVAMVAKTPRGKIGMSHVTRGGLAGRSFDDLMEGARMQLSAGLGIEVRNDPARPELGSAAFVVRSGPWVASAVSLPDFHEQLSGILGSDRLVAGIQSADHLCVAAESSAAARMIRDQTPRSQCPDGPLIPTVLSVTSAGCTVLAER